MPKLKRTNKPTDDQRSDSALSKPWLVAWLILGGVLGIVVGNFIFTSEILSPLGMQTKPQPLKEYSFPQLRQTSFAPSDVWLGRTLETESNDTISRMFYFTVNGKRVSGVVTTQTTATTPPTQTTATTPPTQTAATAQAESPVIVMLRGYVDKEMYVPGVGTQRAAEKFARNGYVVLAPDFFGYGDSDQPSLIPLEARFQTYTTVLTLMRSISRVDSALLNHSLNQPLNENKVGLWGHSNGGHIALATLAVTGKAYPTTLWAPVTQSFPDSILTYSDELPDGGEYLRGIVSDFDKTYTIRHYDPAEYYDWIDAPVQIHQGGTDEYITEAMTGEFVEGIVSTNPSTDLYTYPEDNHQLSTSWETVTDRDVRFFNRYLR